MATVIAEEQSHRILDINIFGHSTSCFLATRALRKSNCCGKHTHALTLNQRQKKKPVKFVVIVILEGLKQTLMSAK